MRLVTGALCVIAALLMLTGCSDDDDDGGMFSDPTRAIIVGADWDTTSSGTLNGIGFTIDGITGGSFDGINVRTLDTADFSAGPLTDVETLEYSADKNYTITFDSPVTDLLFYAASWRGSITGDDDPAITYTFSEAPIVLSGFPDATFGANTITIDDENDAFDSGILRFSGPITPLSVSSDTDNGSGQVLTFGLDVPTLN